MKIYLIDYQANIIKNRLSLNSDIEAIDIDEKDVTEVSFVTDAVLLINVDMKVGGGLRQNQEGINVYRRLLQKGIIRPAIFYSFRKIEDLTGAMPKNEIIKHCPFLRLPFIQEELDQALFQIRSHSTLFNAASENLLAAFGVWKAKHIDKISLKSLLNQKKVLIIEDEYPLWSSTFKAIFGSDNVRALADKKEEILEILGKIDNDTEINQVLKTKNVNDARLIFSDLYLNESHKDLPSSLQNRENLSGFKLFKAIRAYNISIPIIMHTTSNKVWNYKLFDNWGVDDWFVKYDESLKEEDLLAIFENFYDTIALYLNKEGESLYEIGKEVNLFNRNFENNSDIFWWSNRREKNYIKTTLIESYLSISNLFSRSIFEKRYNSDNIHKILVSSTASGIILGLGNIVEVLYKLNGFENLINQVNDDSSRLVFQARNCAAHKVGNRQTTIKDVIISISLLTKVMNKNKKPDQAKIKLPRADNYAPMLLNYMAFYNQSSNKENLTLIRERVFEITESIVFGELKREEYEKEVKTNFLVTRELLDLDNNGVTLEPSNGKKVEVVEIKNELKLRIKYDK